MRRTLPIGVAVAIGMFGFTAATQAAGQAPDSKICNDAANPPKDARTQGGCIATSRTKGACQSCHFIAGIASGNIAPPLVSISQRFPDRARLRAQIEDATLLNPQTVMPPFGKHRILTPDEIDKVVEWVLTL